MRDLLPVCRKLRWAGCISRSTFFWVSNARKVLLKLGEAAQSPRCAHLTTSGRRGRVTYQSRTLCRVISLETEEAGASESGAVCSSTTNEGSRVWTATRSTQLQQQHRRKRRELGGRVSRELESFWYTATSRAGGCV